MRDLAAGTAGAVDGIGGIGVVTEEGAEEVGAGAETGAAETEVGARAGAGAGAGAAGSDMETEFGVAGPTLTGVPPMGLPALDPGPVGFGDDAREVSGFGLGFRDGTLLGVNTPLDSFLRC